MIAAVWEMVRSPWGLLALFGLGLLSDVMWERRQ